MDMEYLFTKKGCCSCDWVKSNVDLSALQNVQVLTLGEDPEALALLAYYECVAISEKQLPILVSDKREIITGAGHIRNHLQKNFG
jgi:hypothetical protein